jgi:hypothetical protein
MNIRVPVEKRTWKEKKVKGIPRKKDELQCSAQDWILTLLHKPDYQFFT